MEELFLACFSLSEVRLANNFFNASWTVPHKLVDTPLCFLVRLGKGSIEEERQATDHCILSTLLCTSFALATSLVGDPERFRIPFDFVLMDRAHHGLDESNTFLVATIYHLLHTYIQYMYVFALPLLMA